jgi:hypothetical protein
MKKRMILICLIGVFVSGANAQMLGIKAGLSFADGKYKLYEMKMSAGSLFGVNTGIVGEVPVSQSFSLGTGVHLIKKGAKSDVYKIPVRYLEFPVNLVYRIDFVTWRLFAQAGTYVGVGISAKKKSNIKEKIEFGPEASKYDRMDFGINLGGGFEIDNLQIGINYGQGFINIANGYEEVIRNRVVSISAVYFLEDIGGTLRDLKDRIF